MRSFGNTVFVSSQFMFAHTLNINFLVSRVCNLKILYFNDLRNLDHGRSAWTAALAGAVVGSPATNQFIMSENNNNKLQL